ncbi:SHOCT domain-containing protein [Paenibacillus sp. YPG26]|uniref:SHOCT domain-containing protein n=1 Tax=Paenibacillus sp. YPG26 TaxID=2878915 RepID=UPI0020419E81|nr:SHOCT domain-containing protein [Paenibacillus sp. YPG26]USB32822.1 SHOCT domain-containing protein [Paenibacillus sp. YPG26]
MKKTTISTKTLAAGVLALSLTLGGGVLAVQHTSAASAKTSSSTTQAQRAGHDRGDRHMGFGKIEEQLLAYLKLDETTFREKQKTQTLAEIASAQGIARADLKAKLVSLLEVEQKADSTSTSAKVDKDGKALDASAFADKLLDSKPGNGFGGKEHGPLGFVKNNEELAKLFGITADELNTQLRSGKTLAAIAGEHNVTVQAVIDLEVSSLSADLESRLDAGEITQADYNTQKAKLTDMATQIVNGQFPAPGEGRGHGGGHFGKFDEVAKLLGITEDALRTELQAGTTLAAVAAEHNVTAQQVIDLLVKDRTAKLAEELAAGTITQTEYDKLKAGLTESVTKQVNSTLPKSGDFKGGRGWNKDKKSPTSTSSSTASAAK